MHILLAGVLIPRDCSTIKGPPPAYSNNLIRDAYTVKKKEQDYNYIIICQILQPSKEL